MATTQVTITANSNRTPSKIYLDSSYLKSVPGILKIVECVVDLCGFISMIVVTSKYYYPSGTFYEFVSMSAFIISLFLLIFHLFHFTDAMQFIPWLLLEVIFSIIWAILYLIAGGISASWADAHSALASAAFFAFVAVVLYLYEGFSKFRIRSSQGENRPTSG
ncbi:CKLF-like MARVEL transmembrane domain-containing protein 8 [Parasteatoda tepidariorum]|uniref:CKLF-like MARVEL transmembrane domain-containing protein 8 n=1 Tax=Parasteatoda tepidariorum TaxID=114398 RepID=UPI00077F8731|nr:MARVEL domain-containing protein 1 [Parasteatoda tepidariorum]XP_015905013.1 MARVEL domain-containing protein 1 [Parasteatoda tepidariorum]XP_015905014.1 MARVEL domain-containing protein 1 [Parasteatoda tepidariorum]XP_015905015.1 MARVEL domain-containing protein 1 [Parasteatoda tepidariorum]